jgi:AcrR family transcriptional regulator
MKDSRTVLKETRRAQLVDSAIRVFARNGYNSASIDEIIKEAGVARGTFYLYFDSKLEVFHAVMARYLELFEKVVARELARPYDNPLSVRKRIRESLLDWLRFYSENRDLAKIAFREAMAIEPDYEKKCLAMLESCNRHWRRSIERFQKLGFVRRDLDPEFLNLVFSGVMINLVLRYILPNPKPDLDKMVDQWLDFLEKGVKTRIWPL